MGSRGQHYHLPPPLTAAAAIGDASSCLHFPAGLVLDSAHRAHSAHSGCGGRICDGDVGVSRWALVALGGEAGGGKETWRQIALTHHLVFILSTVAFLSFAW